MKTAMQELIDYMKGNFHLSDYSIMMFEHFLEKEKEQIRDAYNEGHTDAMEDKPGMTSGTIYYNQTYKPETNEKETNP